MRLSLLLLLIVVGVIPTIPITYGIIGTYRDKAIEERKNDMQSQSASLINLLISTNYVTTAVNEEVNTELKRLSNIFDGRIIVIDSKLTVLKDTINIEDGNFIVSDQVIKSLRNNTARTVYTPDSRIEMTIPISNNSSKEPLGVIIMIFSTNHVDEMETLLVQKAGIIYISVGIIIAVLAILLSAALTKPFIKLKNAIEHVTEGYMDDEVKVEGYHEIEQISNALNQMLIRMKNLERSRQEFVSNVSHELKTPLTSVKVLADSLLMQDGASTELYREFLVDIAEEIERENKIINDLLSLVKLDKTASDMNITLMSINELLELVLKRLRPIAKNSNIELIYESFRPVTAEIDEVKLSLALSNLIENAIKYNLEDGWVRVSLNADHKYFYVKVSDSGIGIPDDAIDFIFDRFYRVDKARSRGTGGTGLGLSITKNVIHMHKGAIKVHSEENEGSTFTVRVPINYIV